MYGALDDREVVPPKADAEPPGGRAEPARSVLCAGLELATGVLSVPLGLNGIVMIEGSASAAPASTTPYLVEIDSMI